MISPRLAPQMIGMGLLEAIPEADIVGRADPDDADGDGISGSAEPGRGTRAREQTELGRFGWKANVPTVEAQAAGAFHGDIGITSSLHPDQDCTATQTDCAAAHQRWRTRDHRRAGLAASRSTPAPWPCRRCATSTTTTSRTGPAAFERARLRVVPHADTHHRRCPTSTSPRSPIRRSIPTPTCCCTTWATASADDRPDFEATGTEWRTPPLWGIGPDRRGQRPPVPAPRRPGPHARRSDPVARRRGEPARRSVPNRRRATIAI